jgi:hypothetical protein
VVVPDARQMVGNSSLVVFFFWLWHWLVWAHLEVRSRREQVHLSLWILL